MLGQSSPALPLLLLGLRAAGSAPLGWADEGGLSLAAACSRAVLITKGGEGGRPAPFVGPVTPQIIPTHSPLHLHAIWWEVPLVGAPRADREFWGELTPRGPGTGGGGGGRGSART